MCYCFRAFFFFPELSLFVYLKLGSTLLELGIACYPKRRSFKLFDNVRGYLSIVTLGGREWNLWYDPSVEYILKKNRLVP